MIEAGTTGKVVPGKHFPEREPTKDRSLGELTRLIPCQRRGEPPPIDTRWETASSPAICSRVSIA